MSKLVLSRRQVLVAAAACGLVGTASCSGGTDAGAGDHPGSGRPGASPTTAPSDLPDGVAVARRFAFAPTVALIELARGDATAFFDQQLDPSLPERPEVAALLSATDPGDVPTEGGPAARRAALGALVSSTLAVGAWSTGQLRAVMTDFWADHLHVSSSLAPEVLFTPAYRRLLSDGALGRFDDLLVSSARSAAMLISLDNASSRADGGRVPNENYGRELLELQTVGLIGSDGRSVSGRDADAPYSEDDVKAVAHVLSGWSLERGTRRFAFRPAWHDLGPAAGADVLGWTPAGSGEQDGEDLLRHLAQHPATSRHITWKLARRFVADDVAPDDEIVDELAGIYREGDTDIGPVLRRIGALVGTGDRSLPTGSGAKLRRPLDLVAAMLGSTIAVPDPATWQAALRPIGRLLQSLGQVPMGWPAPDGFPEVAGAWSGPGAVIGRWNLASAAAGGFDVLSADPAVAPLVGDELVTTVTGIAPSDRLSEALAPVTEPRSARAVLFASPEFQLR